MNHPARVSRTLSTCSSLHPADILHPAVVPDVSLRICEPKLTASVADHALSSSSRWLLKGFDLDCRNLIASRRFCAGCARGAVPVASALA